MKQDLLDSLKPEQQKLNEQVASRIEKLIHGGELKAGDRLPSERALADFLKINRGTAREAIHLLSERGLLERKGRKTLVTEMGPHTLGSAIRRYFVSNSCQQKDLHDIRVVLEPRIARLAAENARPEDLVRLRNTLEQLEESWTSKDFKRLGYFDIEFHRALAAATHNDLIVGIIHGLGSVVEKFLHLNYFAFGQHEESFQTHREIYEAVLGRNAPLAEEAMRRQMITSPMNTDERDRRLLNQVHPMPDPTRDPGSPLEQRSSQETKSLSVPQSSSFEPPRMS